MGELLDTVASRTCFRSPPHFSLTDEKDTTLPMFSDDLAEPVGQSAALGESPSATAVRGWLGASPLANTILRDEAGKTIQSLPSAELASLAYPAGGVSASQNSACGQILVAVSKLQPPGAHRGAVVRQALLDRLAKDISARLVVVVAPAGWGKTSLLRDWCSAAGATPTAWLSIDRADNDPMRFWADVIAAVSRVSPGLKAALEVVMAPGVVTAEALLTRVINELAALPSRVTLVLDDFHLIINETILEGVEFLVEHLPPTFGLVLASRSDPALCLDRLRGRGELAEIRADDLRFSEQEAAQLLNSTLGLALLPEDVAALQQRTEGWATGLYLAGLSLRGSEDSARLIREFSGDDRRIVDYLAAEVLDGQPAAVRSFLLRTSILGRFCGPLCDAVTATHGSLGLLEELERSQLFLVPLDTRGDWYRYHALFGELLRRQLDRSEPGLAALLHRRASAWHRQHGSISEAIGHAISAADLDDARELIGEHWNRLLYEAPAETCESWLDKLPPGTVADDARLCLLKGFVARDLGRLEDVEPWLSAAEAIAPKDNLTEGPLSIQVAACVLRATYRHLVGDLAGAESASRQALALKAQGIRRWLAAAQATLAASLLWRGQYDEASRLLDRLPGPVHWHGNDVTRVWSLGCLSAVAVRRGDVEACERALSKAAEIEGRLDLGGHWLTATAFLACAELLADRGRLAEAKEKAMAALRRAQNGQARVETAAALLCLARIQVRAGDLGGARAGIGEARDLIDRCKAPGILTDLLAENERLAGGQTVYSVAGGHGRVRRPDGLTSREAEVLHLLAAGNTNKEIAAELVVSVHTIERHLQNSYRKVGVRNRADAAAYIVRSAG